MRLSKEQIKLIAEVNSMYETNSSINNRLRLLADSMLNTLFTELNPKQYDYFQIAEYRRAKAVCVTAGSVLMSGLFRGEASILDADPDYEQKVSMLLDDVATILYKELKIAICGDVTTPTYNLLYGYISELGSFYHVLLKDLTFKN